MRLASSAASRACGFRLAPLTLGDVGVDQDEAAARNGVAAHFNDPPIRSGSLLRPCSTGSLSNAVNSAFSHVSSGAVIASFCEVTDVARVGALFREEGVGYVEDFLELAVPCDQMLCCFEHGDAVAHILECDADFLLTLADLSLQQPRVFHRDNRLSGKALQ